MQSIFFGKSSSPIYGVIQEPAGNTFEDYAVLICCPFGQEYMRSHRAFRQLASMLSKKGVASLRFDYRGTGDSFGEQSEFSIKQACNDIKAAYKELKSLTAVDKVYVVGLRLGAALACMALAGKRDVLQICLWDPVIDGKKYVDEIYQSMDEAKHSDIIVNDVWWVNGFPVSPELRAEISSINLQEQKYGKQCQLFQVVAQEYQEHTNFKQFCESTSIKMLHEIHHGAGGNDWNVVDDEGSFLLPNLALNAIVKFITQRKN